MDEEDKKAIDLWIGHRALAICLPLFAVAVIVYAVRIWTRIRPKSRLNAADYTITVAFIAETISITLTIVAVASGFGRPTHLLSTEDIEVIGVSTFIVFIVGYWASTFARVSIALLLISIIQKKVWRGFLWSIIVFNILVLAAMNTAQLFQCRPLRAVWASVPDAKCMPPETIWNIGYISNSLWMVCDAIFAILPSALIWRLSREPLEKVLLSLLMGLGLLAMAAGVPKILTMKLFDVTSDNVVGDMMPCYLWSRIEEIMLIIAACAPLMKVPLEGLLNKRFGLPRFRPNERKLNTISTLPARPPTSGGYFYSWRGRSQVFSKEKLGSQTTTTTTTTTTTMTSENASPSPV
ncbi:hypothetical protein B0T16DRAFT_406357 [Cercophora newfieldiana]|uniref:Rhodopsin domain-containing protein n=1 Tax=Cercophora newfieldiana TaxID=92897 RepID=A0AA40CVV2_9PEZI|nr:hypothetical protein B0T16DRAFT_406357 [Cercophora newfieldiana]